MLYALCDWRIHNCPVLRETMRTMVNRAISGCCVVGASWVSIRSRVAMSFVRSAELRCCDACTLQSFASRPCRGEAGCLLTRRRAGAGRAAGVRCPFLQVDEPEVTADVMRAEPVGEDGRGARYYFLSGGKHEDCYLFK